MNSNDKQKFEQLIKKLVSKFGTPNYYPTEDQAEQIVREISKYSKYDRTDAIYRSIIKKHISYREEIIVEAYDLSDTNNTLDEIVNILDD